MSELYSFTCDIERRADSGTTDALGDPVYVWPDTPHITGAECYWQDRGTRELARRIIAKIDEPRLFMAWGTDVLSEDRISNIKLNSTVIAAGPLEITRIALFPEDHIEIELEKIG